ncbi:cytosine permease [Arthrobacter sp. AK01]|uniref:purine-cytosine permease family protein n=1 Tax=Micrococcaceae TaxID=1268 RepID=UPI001E516975|nr:MULTISPECIES: cytosine permease [Micrococcaceae]MCD4852035.1 cytosine permease [Arthrobacter sp. AK01]MCP1413745.1 cytosine/uracil/thiamine/allantoin permease [Paenarthrobacter sp. A20]
MAETPAELEARLAQKYRQPKAVEQFGVEVIPDELRTVRWWDIFTIVLNFLVNPGTITISGLLISSGMSLWEATLAGILSVLVGFSAYLVAATVGSDYAIPGLVSMRSVFGVRGATVTSALRAVSSVYWFAFQTVAAATGIAVVLEALLHSKVDVLWISVGCAILQLTVSIYGYNALMKLSRFAFIFKIVFSAVIVYLLMTFPHDGFAPHQALTFGGANVDKTSLIIFWMIAWGTSWFSNFTDAADFCRYTRRRSEMWIGTISAAIVGQLICSFIGGYAVAAVRGEAPEGPLGVIVESTRGVGWLLALVLAYIVLDAWIINVQNLYTAGLALTSMFKNLGRFWGTLIVGILGTALSTSQHLISGFDGAMGQLGNLFAPMAGVFIAHYVIASRWRIDVPALFRGEGSRYWYWNGVNWLALASVAVGVPVNAMVPQVYANIIISALTSGLLYLAAVALLRRRVPVLAAALDSLAPREELVPSPGPASFRVPDHH